jgi:DNA-binding response OmpR family regulator
MRKVLLSVGTNHSLLGMRNMVLIRAGYEVVPARSGAAALKAINSRTLDAIIVGHSVSQGLKEKIVGAAKLKCLPAVVLHANPYEAHVRGADASLCGIDGAARIIEVLSELL